MHEAEIENILAAALEPIGVILRRTDLGKVVLRFTGLLSLLVVGHGETIAPYAQAYDRSRADASNP